MSRKAIGWSIASGVAAIALIVGFVAAYSGGHPYGHPASAPPAAPQGARATPGDSSVTVSWAAPAYSGSTSTVQYVVTATPGSASCSSVARSCTVVGLTNGVAYTLTVVARDRAGTSAAARVPGTVTPTNLAPASTPRLAVSPSSGLANGATVTVSGSGFIPSDQVFLVECLVKAAGRAGCDVATATPVTISSSGRLPPTSFTVVTGTVGTGACGTSPSNAAACAVSAGNSSGTDSAVAPITFK